MTMKEPVYIKLFLDYLDALEPFSDAERGRLFTALLIYGRTGEAPQLSGNERFLFPMMKAQIDRDFAAWREKDEHIHNVRVEAGGKGGKARASKSKQNQANQANASKPEQTKHKTTDYGLLTTDDYTPPYPPCGGDGETSPWTPTPVPESAANAGSANDAEFDRFWEAYPRKQAKGAARKAFAKARKKVSLGVMLAAVEAQKTSWEWTKEGGQYIPCPSSWLNQEQWANEWNGGSPQGGSPSPPGQRRKTVAEIRAEKEAQGKGDWK